MPLTAIMGGSAIFSAIEGYHASTTAATQQQQGAQQAAALEKPAMDVGNSALNRLAAMYGLTAPPAGTATAATRPGVVTPPATPQGSSWANNPNPVGPGSALAPPNEFRSSYN